MPSSSSFSHRRGRTMLWLAAINQPVPWVFVVAIYPNYSWLGAFFGLGLLLPLLYAAMGYAPQGLTRALTIGALLWAASQPLLSPQLFLGGLVVGYVSVLIPASPPQMLHCVLATFVYGFANWLLALLIGGVLYLLGILIAAGFRAVFPVTASPSS